MNKKIIIILNLLCLLLFIGLLSPLVSASPILVTQQLTTGDSLDFDETDYKYGQAFNATSTFRLTNITVWLGQLESGGGNTVGSVALNLYTAIGTYGTNSLPNTLVAQSNIWYNIDTMPTSTDGTSFQDYNFTFSNQDVVLTANQKYVFIVEPMYDYTAAGNGHLVIEAGANAQPNLHNGNSFFTYGTQWYADTDDLKFQVFGDTELTSPTTTPTPTPTPSPTPEAMPNWISDIIDAIIPIFTPLLVIFICGALGWRFAGAWGFFAGINLAIVLLYVIAPSYMPLWAIIAVVIIDIGLLFGKVGFDRR